MSRRRRRSRRGAKADQLDGLANLRQPAVHIVLLQGTGQWKAPGMCQNDGHVTQDIIDGSYLHPLRVRRVVDPVLLQVLRMANR